LCFSLGIRGLVPAVPRKSLHPLHAPSTPVAVCPVIRHLTDLSQKGYTLLVLTTFASLRRVFEGFTFVRLSDAHLHEIDPALLPQCSPPRLFTAAAWSGLGSAPESRSRGANPHLSRSLSTRLVSPRRTPFRVCLQHTEAQEVELLFRDLADLCLVLVHRQLQLTHDFAQVMQRRFGLPLRHRITRSSA
jgi:hypothetical protein